MTDRLYKHYMLGVLLLVAAHNYVDRTALGLLSQSIKVDLQLNKIGKNRELLPHKKFKHANVWLSDDTDRLVLRIETQIFIGTVFAELQSVQFDHPKQ